MDVMQNAALEPQKVQKTKHVSSDAHEHSVNSVKPALATPTGAMAAVNKYHISNTSKNKIWFIVRQQFEVCIIRSGQIRSNRRRAKDKENKEKTSKP